MLDPLKHDRCTLMFRSWFRDWLSSMLLWSSSCMWHRFCHFSIDGLTGHFTFNFQTWAGCIIWWAVQSRVTMPSAYRCFTNAMSVMLQLRLYALYGSSKKLLIFMVTLFAAEVGIMLWVMIATTLEDQGQSFRCLLPRFWSLPQEHSPDIVSLQDTIPMMYNYVPFTPPLRTDTYGLPYLLSTRFWSYLWSGPLLSFHSSGIRGCLFLPKHG